MGQQLCSIDIAKRAREELKLEPWFFRIKEGSFHCNGFCPRTPAEIKCLVHCEWLDSICNGRVPPKVVRELLPEEADLYLQDSCHLQLPPSWRLVSVCIIGRSSQEDGDRSDPSPSDLLQPMPCIPTDSVWEFFSHTAYYNQRLQWAEEVERDNNCGGVQMKQPRLTRALFHAIVRELYSVSVTPLTASTDLQPPPDASATQEAATETFSHPNLSPLLAALESETAFYLIHPHEPFLLRDLAMHSPAVLKGKESHLQFLVYQMFQLLKFLHKKGINLGEVGLSDIHVDNCLWLHFRLLQCGLQVETSSPAEAEALEVGKVLEEDGLAVEASSKEEGISESEDGQGHIWGSAHGLPLQEALLRWQRGELDNFDYLMILNHAAGRRMEDSNNHPILPWVTDFHNPSGSWRDLTKTKHRLTKGDRQMDFAYQGAKDEAALNPDSTVVPHHVGDLLTDVTYYMYMARKTPKEVLCSRVRPNWVPGEYPLSIEHIYHWTPDECIPEFYCDPSVFRSIHKDLPDLAIPTWSTSAEDFVAQHRAMLESDHVSAHLHSWIDLTFGSKLTGEASVKARNVHLAIEDSHRRLSAYGVVQLFEHSHPRRLINSQSAPYTLEHPIHDLHPAIYERHMKHATYEAGSTEKDSLEKESKGTNDPLSGENEEESSEANCEQSMSTKLVFKEVDLGDVNTHRLTPYSIGDDSFEDLTMVAEFSSGRDGPKSVEETDFGPASLSDASAFLFATSAPKLMWETATEAPLKGKIPTAIAALPVPFRRRGHPGNETEENSWKGEAILIPKDFSALTRLQRLEETTSFLLRSFQSRPQMSLLTELWTAEDLASFATDEHGSAPAEKAASTYFWEMERALSSEEEEYKDIVLITCLAAELFLYKHVKTTLYDGMALSERVNLIRAVTESGRVRVSYFISSLVEYVFAHLDRAAGTTSLGLPGHSVPLVLQQLVPIYYFPPYFPTVHQFLAGLVEEKQRLSCNLSTARMQQCEGHNTIPHVKSMNAIEYVCRNWGRVVYSVDGEGIEMLLTHLIAFFQLPFIRVEMVGCLFEDVTQYLNQALMVKHFLPLIQSLYDTSCDPHAYGSILHRPFLHCLINRFGLVTFIRYCLPYLRDAVVDPSSARFPYLQQRPISLLDSESYSQQQRNSSKVEEKEVLAFSMSLGDRVHPPTPPPSPVVDGSDIEEDEGDIYQEGGSEGRAVYEEYSLLLQAEIHEKLESTSPQVTTASGSNLPQGLTSVELFAEEPVFQYKSPNPSEEDSDVATFRRRAPSQTSTESQQTLGNEEDRRRLDLLASAVDPQPSEPTEKGNTPLDTPSQSVDVSEDTQPFTKVSLSHTGTDEGENEEQKGPELSHEVLTKEVDDRMMEVCDFLSRVALDSLQWLTQLLGPILCTRHIAQPLLNSLPRSFTNCLKERVKSVPAIQYLSHIALVYGDPVVTKLYLPQVEKWMSNFEKQGRSQRNESGLAAAVCLLDMCLQSLEPVTLESMIKSFAADYFTPLVHFVVSTKAVFTTGSGGRSFVCQAILQLFLTTCRLMGRERSLEISELKQAVQVFFSTFDEVLSDPNASIPPSSLAVANIKDSFSHTPLEYDQEAMDQLKTVFTPALARYAYVQFCHSIGQLKLKGWLYNTENIERIAMIDDLVGTELEFEQSVVVSLVHSQQVTAEGEEETESEDEGSDTEDVAQLQRSIGPLQAHIETPALRGDSSVKERSLWFMPTNEEDVDEVALQQDEATFWTRYKHAGVNTDHQLPMITKNDPENRDLVQQQRKLEGNWEDKWEIELGTIEGVREHPMSVAGLRLQAFAGHKSNISKLLPIETENIFISASRDKTVKLWSLSNHGNGEGISHPKLTYSLHQKAIVGLEHLPAKGQVASCGNKLHIWDLETAYCVREYSPKSSQPYVAMTTIATPFPMLVLGTLDGRLHLVDVRSKELAQSWRVGVDSSSNVTLRKLATDQRSSWLAAVSTGSLVHTLDPRTGEVLKGWKALEAGVGTVGAAVFGQEIVAIKATERGHIATGSGSGSLSMWTRRGELLQTRKDSSLALQYFDIVGDQLIGVSNGNQLVFYNSIDHQLPPPAKIFKLHNRLIRGTATVCTPLQHNRTLLLGNDAGQIVLMA